MEKQEARKQLYGKIKVLQEEMLDMNWEKDGKNRNQKYKYFTEAQYKANFKKALLKSGLIWKMETVGREFVGQISASMHLVFATFKGKLIDPETGEFEEYNFEGSGADMGDKALYKAYTGALKYFLASNFLVAEYNDPEKDETVDEPQKTKGLNEGMASEMQIGTLKKQLKELVKKDPSKEDLVLKIGKETKGFKTLTQKQCEDYILKIGEML